MTPGRSGPPRGIVAGLPIYPLLLATAFVLAFPAASVIRPHAVGRALPVVLAAAMVLVLIAVAIYRDPDRAGLAASLAVFLAIAGTDTRVAIAVAIALSVIWIESRRRHRARWKVQWALVTRIGLVFSAALVVILLVQASGNWLSRQAARVESDWDSATPAVGHDRPDIYLILADGMGRADVLSDGYGLDSAPFLDRLESLGFDVARASRTNYMMTQLALASMLNGNYLDGLGVADGEPVPSGWLETAIEDPAAMRLLRRAGYETIVVPSGYEGVRVEHVDVFLDGGHLSEVEGVMLEGTAVDVVLDGVWPTFVADSVRGRTIEALAAVERLAQEGASRTGRPPRFVMIHLPVPHFPFVFGPNCEEINGGIPNVAGSPETGSAKTPAEMELEIGLTAGQSACMQALLFVPVTHLVELNPGAVVLLFSDHGPEARLDWWRPDDEGMWERLANFVAVYAPGHAGLLPDDVTLVNVLPRMFNAYLGTDLALHDDRTYFGLDRVTDAVRLVEAGL